MGKPSTFDITSYHLAVSCAGTVEAYVFSKLASIVQASQAGLGGSRVVVRYGAIRPPQKIDCLGVIRRDTVVSY